VTGISLSGVEWFMEGFHLERADTVVRVTDGGALRDDHSLAVRTFSERPFVDHLLKARHGQHEDACEDERWCVVANLFKAVDEAQSGLTLNAERALRCDHSSV
jgi:hypothetical protein